MFLAVDFRAAMQAVCRVHTVKKKSQTQSLCAVQCEAKCLAMQLLLLRPFGCTAAPANRNHETSMVPTHNRMHDDHVQLHSAPTVL